MNCGAFGRRFFYVRSAARLPPMDLFDVLIPLALAAVAITLAFGIYSLYRGGDFGRSYSNKLMRLRVLMQFIAVIVLVAAFWWRTKGG
jgi:uncharacterized membrane protein